MSWRDDLGFPFRTEMPSGSTSSRGFTTTGAPTNAWKSTRYSNLMLRDVTEARPLDLFRLFLRFDDGQSGEIDIRDLVPFDGVFAPLRDPEFFAQVRINPELGSIEWPNGADLDTQVLYSRITGQPLAGESTLATA